ncbi:hypothetical protein GCM10020001_070700 [Nonomuraea salmonea]
MRHGYYQGWDMHPSHLVSRFATVYAFHLARYDAYRERVLAWQERRDAGGRRHGRTGHHPHAGRRPAPRRPGPSLIEVCQSRSIRDRHWRTSRHSTGSDQLARTAEPT